MIEGHGDDLYRYGGLVKYNFSSNIYSAVNHDGLAEYLSKRISEISHYPEPRCYSIEAALADEAGLGRDNLLVTNGATECIYMIAHCMAGCKTAIIAPAFREYQDACTLNRMEVVFVTDMNDVPDDAEVVWICNPANPTGVVTLHDKLMNTIESHRNKLFVVDQAYAEYTTRQLLSAQECVAAGNVIMLSSLTKRFSVPGLRIGYCIGAAPLVERLCAYRQPWSVNSMAIAATDYLMAHKADYKIDVEFLHSEAMRMRQAMTDMGVEVSPTDCNFMLCRLPYGTAAQLKEYMITRHGILIRDASNFETLSPAHFRVAAQSAEENDLFINTLRKWIGM